MARAIEEGELKALVRQLVKAAGGVEACGVLLGVSHQRVSQLQSPNNPDQMSFLQIAKLECVAERAIVSGAQVRAVEGDGCGPLHHAVVEAVTKSASALEAVAEMEGHQRPSAADAKHVQQAAQENLHAAECLADAAAHIQARSAT